MTELFMGFGAPSTYGSTATTTPPEIRVGPEGTLSERWLPVTSMSLAPRSAIPIPEKFLPNSNGGSNCAARHERVLFSTVLPFTSKSPTGVDGKASKNMPAQLSWIVFPAMEPRLVSATYMPHGPPEMLLPTTFAFAGFGPKMVMPVLPERLTSLETILVPVESRITVPTKVLSMMSLLETILVPVESMTSTPRLLSVRSLLEMVALVPSSIKIPLLELPSTSFPEMVTSRDLSRPIASSPESRTTLERNLVLIERKVPMPFLLPTARIFVTVASRAAATSIPTVSKPRTVKPLMLTSSTYLRTSPVSGLKSPRTQIAVGPETLEQSESALALAGASITASSSPRSFIPFLRIITSSL